MNHRATILTSIIVLFAVLFTACSEGDTDSISNVEVSESDVDKTKADSLTERKALKTKRIFYTIPSPMETAHLLHKAGATYNYQLLNDVRNVKNYTTTNAKSLNLGVYGTNLSYTSLYYETQETMLYMESVKRLADDLGVTQAIDKRMIERMEANIEKRDSMMHLISAAFQEIDAYLKANERDNTAALVVAGGWVEGMYLATSLLADNNYRNEEIKSRVIDQKYSFNDLMNLLSLIEDDRNVEDIITRLEPVKNTFEMIEIKKSPMTVEVDQSKKKAVLGGDADIKVEEGFFEEMFKVSSEIRNHIINLE